MTEVGRAWPSFPNKTASSGEPGRVPERDAEEIVPVTPAAKIKGRPSRAAPRTLVFLFVHLAETLDPTGGVHQLLLAGVKGMARRANFRRDVAFGRFGLK